MSFFGSRNSILALSVITALIHLVLAFKFRGDPELQGLMVPFILNGVGYLALMYATLWTPDALKGQKALLRWAFLGFTAVTIVLYFVFNGSYAFRDVLGLLTKLDEVLLMVSIWQYKS